MRRQVLGLDGLRGLAALYVVLFHCWLYTFPGYPHSSAPRVLDVLMFGRLAVVFFLVLSGFSLAISPARHGWRTGGVGRFLRRRAWRILPPYWAALAMSLAVSLYMVPASHHGPPTGSSVLVYGLVLQDVLFAPTPNGAFWSIGVEAELYLLFPLILLLQRRFSAAVAVACVTLPVIARGLLAPAPTRSRATTGSPRISPPCSSRVWWGRASSSRRSASGGCRGGGSPSWPPCPSWRSVSSRGPSGPWTTTSGSTSPSPPP